MTDPTSITDLRRPISFSIDGERYRTEVRRQRAEDLLRLAARDPANFDLAEVADNGRTHRYSDDDFVTVREGSRFVSIRQSAPVA